jgi:thiamine transport system permease protein
MKKSYISLFFLLLFFYLPIISILATGLSLHNFSYILTDRYYQKIIYFTIKQAFLSTVVTLLVGLPGAYIVSNYDFFGRKFIKSITMVPFVLPSILVVLSFVVLFGNNGMVNSFLRHLNLHVSFLYTWKAIILAHAFYNFPLVIRIVGASWERLSAHIEETAKTLGARRFFLFRKVTFPLLLPSILTSAILTFIFCFTSFAIVLAFGGVRYTTMEVEIYYLLQRSNNFALGCSLAILQILFLISLMFLYSKFSGMYLKEEKITKFKRKKKLRFSLGELPIYLYFLLVFFMIILPMAAVGYYSLTRFTGFETVLSSYWYKMIFGGEYSSVIGSAALESIKNSLLFGSCTVLLSLSMGIPAAYLRKVEIFFLVPLVVSGVTLGLGILKLFPFSGWWRIVLAHSLIAYPFVVRSVYIPLKKLDPSLLESALSLGASRIYAFFKIELPMIFSGIVVASSFAFAISVGELAATYLLYDGKYITMPIFIYRFISARHFGGAAAMGVFLMIITGIVFVIIDRIKEVEI